jgi:hypothetical protein
MGGYKLIIIIPNVFFCIKLAFYNININILFYLDSFRFNQLYNEIINSYFLLHYVSYLYLYYSITIFLE